MSGELVLDLTQLFLVNVSFGSHKDHIHPISKFNINVLKGNNIAEDQYEFFLNSEHNNSILNLQMLDSNENESKQDMELKDWIEIEATKQGISIYKICENHLIPKGYLEIKEFMLFIEERKNMLMRILKSIF